MRGFISRNRVAIGVGLGGAAFAGILASVSIPIDSEPQTNFVRIGLSCPGDFEPQLSRIETIPYVDASTSRGSLALRCVSGHDTSAVGPEVNFYELDGESPLEKCPGNDSNSQEYIFRVDHTEEDYIIGSSDPLEINLSNREGPDTLTIRIPRIDGVVDATQSTTCEPIPQVRLSDGL